MSRDLFLRSVSRSCRPARSTAPSSSCKCRCLRRSTQRGSSTTRSRSSVRRGGSLLKVTGLSRSRTTPSTRTRARPQRRPSTRTATRPRPRRFRARQGRAVESLTWSTTATAPTSTRRSRSRASRLSRSCPSCSPPHRGHRVAKSQRWGSGDARFAPGALAAGALWRRGCSREFAGLSAGAHLRSPPAAPGAWRCRGGSMRWRSSAASSSPITPSAPSCCARASPPSPSSSAAGRRAREDVCRGRQPVSGRPSPWARSTRSSSRFRARSSRTRWRATSATSRSSAPTARSQPLHRRAQRRPRAHRRHRARSRAGHPRPALRRGVLLPRGPHQPLESFVEQLDTIVFQEKLGSLGDKVRRTERLAARSPRSSTRRPRTPRTPSAPRTSPRPTSCRARSSSSPISRRHGRLLRRSLRARSRRRRGDRRPLPAAFRRRRPSALARGQHRRDRRQARHHRRHLRSRHGADRLGRPLRASTRRHRRAADAARGTAGHARRADRRGARRLRGRLPLRREATGAAIKEFFVGRLQRSCATAATPTTPSTPCWRSPATTLPTRSLAARRSPRFAHRATTWRTSRSPSRGPRTSREPSWASAVDASIMGPEELALADALDRAENNAAELAVGSRLLGAARDLRRTARAHRRVLRGVMVMDDDPAERENRLRLLNRFVALFGTFADFSLLAG